MPNCSRTRSWIIRTSSITSAAVPPPRLMMASVCFVDSPTLPCVKPFWKPACSMSHAAESFTSSPAGKCGASGARAANAAYWSGGQNGIHEERAVAARVGIARIEHHPLALADGDHRLAHARADRRAGCRARRCTSAARDTSPWPVRATRRRNVTESTTYRSRSMFLKRLER